jgi:hypothetical protein
MSAVIDDLIDEHETAMFCRRYAADFGGEAGVAAHQDAGREVEDLTRWQGFLTGLTTSLRTR